ncbi:unnamed protein product [Pieris macdunnoughi]|uniref:Uncharacterized protein n=1 Tax=Pieris macdunnoughi TaxID=345717 RepID=A0A821T5X1_9NEOP|nr:unnamed protein product [Pieris macdunnoughi]
MIEIYMIRYGIRGCRGAIASECDSWKEAALVSLKALDERYTVFVGARPAPCACAAAARTRAKHKQPLSFNARAAPHRLLLRITLRLCVAANETSVSARLASDLTPDAGATLRSTFGQLWRGQTY